MKLKMLLIASCLTLAFGTGTAAAEELIAAILTGKQPSYVQAHNTMEKIIRSAGQKADKVKIFSQSPNPDKMSLTNSLRRTIAAGATLVITYGAPASLVAMEEVKDVPVLFVDLYDPVALGVVKTLSAPGANRSGTTSKIAPAPLLETLLEIHPGINAIGGLFSAAEAGSDLQVEDYRKATENLGKQFFKLNIASAQAVPGALTSLAGKVDALFLSESVVIAGAMDEIRSFAKRQKIPVVSATPSLLEQGALLTRTVDPDEQGKLIGVYALQILAGQKAFILPVREPKKILLGLNMKVASELNLNISPSVLAKATQVLR